MADAELSLVKKREAEKLAAREQDRRDRREAKKRAKKFERVIQRRHLRELRGVLFDVKSNFPQFHSGSPQRALTTHKEIMSTFCL